VPIGAEETLVTPNNITCTSTLTEESAAMTAEEQAKLAVPVTPRHIQSVEHGIRQVLTSLHVTADERAPLLGDCRSAIAMIHGVYSPPTPEGGKAAMGSRPVVVKVQNASEGSREAQILQRLHQAPDGPHPNIVRFVAHRVCGRRSYLVMEKAGAAEWLDAILPTSPGTQPTPQTEEELRPLVGQLLSAVHFMHTAGVCHLDLKLENIMLRSRQSLVVIDFGLGSIDYEFKQSGRQGSPGYMAPEVADSGFMSFMRGGYDGRAADVWAIGISLFAAATGFFPWEEARSTCRHFRSAQLAQRSGSSLVRAVFASYSMECLLTATLVELLDTMLVVDPRQRASPEAVLNSAWLLDESGTSTSDHHGDHAPASRLVDLDDRQAMEAPPEEPEAGVFAMPELHSERQ
jgi:serine/threonine protein kinase